MNYLVHHLLQSSARRLPAKEALVHEDIRISYAEIDKYTNRLANGLLSADLKRGDRIGIFLDHSIQQVLSIYGISKAGAVFVPINPLLFPDQVRHIVNDCGITGIVTSHAMLDSLRQILPETPSVNFLITTEGVSNFSTIQHELSFEEIVDAGSSKPLQDVCIDKDLAAILYTSGSTGRPKGVMLSHANLLAGSSIVSSYLEITEQERILSILPFSFDYGLNQLLTAFEQGGTLALLSFRFPNEIVQTLVKERITGLAGVPTLWSLLAQPRSTFHRHQFPHLRYITNSGGDLPLEIMELLRKALPSTQIFRMYGLTEAFRSTYLPPDELELRPNSIGKTIPDTEILVVNENGELCKPGEVGELVHRGPTVSLGYWGQPEATDRVLRPNPFLPSELQDTEKVCYSGDLVKMDSEGFLYFVARRDTMIKSSGYRISPSEVEDVLFQSGKIREAAVIGIPDRILGHYILAFVAPHENEELRADELVDFCAQKMPRHMVPRQIEILKDLPKTGNGKVDYPTLHSRVKNSLSI